VYLATVGSNAPFVGLFGTVLGIMRAFHDLSLKSADAMEAVMAGIAEALVATAVGLFVAIPAVVLYNLFSRWVRGRMSRSDSLADLVVARLRGGTSGATHG
jgi:biopolymer transport protein ExbB